MASWSLLTVHIIPAIALQLMQGLYNGQQRHLTSKKTKKITVQKFLDFIFRKMLTIWFGLYNLNQWYLCLFGRVRENAAGWEK